MTTTAADRAARPLPQPRRAAARRRRALDRRARGLVDDLPRPSSILVVSAHWELAPIAVSATTGDVPLLYDFWGFPQRYYEVTYDAPGAPELARSVAGLLSGAGETLHQDPTRGLDHGAYVPLKEMFPEADVPVLQLSMPTLDPQRLFALGERLAPLRDENVLDRRVRASRRTTWPGSTRAPAPDAAPPTASAEFDHWAAETVGRGDVDAVLDFLAKAPAAREAHPRTEHWAPLYVALGAAAASGGVDAQSVIDGFWFGLSKRSWQFA